MNAFQKFARYRHVHGTRAALSAVYRKITTGRADGGPDLEGAVPESAGSATGPGSSALPRRNDVIGFFEGILGTPHGSPEALAASNPGEKTLQWVIPNFGFGSGGHLNIFRFINNLADLGYEQRLVIVPPHNWSDPERAKNAIAEWYMPLKADVALGVDGFRPAHATIATGWQTAYHVAKYAATRDRFYFVQDFEPAFYAMSSEYAFAENTYRLGLKGITAGTWLSEKLSRDYGMKTGAFSFSCDLDVYQPGERREEDHFNILFYSRHVTKRRMFELGTCALDLVCRDHPEVTVIFAGGDVGKFHIPFNHLNGGEMKLSELPPLYQQCDLSLVLSGTNLSLLPLELAASHCPLVMNDSPCASWLLPDDACYYAPLDPEGLAEVIKTAIRDDAGRRERADRAREIAAGTSWRREAETVAHLIETL